MTDVVTGARVLDLDGLQELIDALAGCGYTVIGPTVRDGAVTPGTVSKVGDLPVGWGDDQDAGRYRLRRRADAKVFAFASGAQSSKPVFFPAEEVLWRGRRTSEGFDVSGGSAGPEKNGPYALLGVRSCDLAAVGIQDQVLLERGFQDAAYAARRADSFIVAVTCSDPGGTCFCVSMGTGPRPSTATGAAYDLGLTEVLDEDGHRFVVSPVSDRGAEVLASLSSTAAGKRDTAAAERVASEAASRMGRTMDPDGLKELLYDSAESPVWDEVATRCLACTNCTLVCPTCFCTTVTDITDLAGTEDTRERVWDSCFSADFSYIHGGAVRGSTRSRYRQWATHKLASWIDQFGTSGCVGCGRCITWCPAAIDITATVAALRDEAASRRSEEA